MGLRGLQRVAKVIARIRGGLGNQLFCYAAARRLALVNGAELVIDDTTGFVRDYHYRRRYSLDKFRITARKATPAERMEPLGRHRRAVAKFLAGKCSFCRRRYVEQKGVDFDARLLSLTVQGTVYLDGYWQSEGYFKDVESTVREDLQIDVPLESIDQEIAEQIGRCNAVAVHVRWFDSPEARVQPNNVAKPYYTRAIDEVRRRVSCPHFFVFSDRPDAAMRRLTLPEDQVTCVYHDTRDERACEDLWLMSQCKHFIIANSTFSWWGAWLGEHRHKIVVAPGFVKYSGVCGWGFEGLIPRQWIRLA